MTSEHYENSPTVPDMETRKLLPAMMRGAGSRCPSCGEGRLFERGMKVVDHCENCGEALHHHRADDLPAYLNIFIVGHIVVAAAMIALQWKLMDMWTLMGITIALTIIIAVLAMRPLKGMVVGAQWALRMHGFGGHDD